jgi:flavin-dependent dehydrogenase
VGLAFDKEVLFRCMLNEVLDAGAEVFPGVDVGEVSFTAGDCVQAAGSGMTVNGRYLIAADGTNSSIAEQLGCNRSRLFYSYLLSAGCVMRDVQTPRGDALISSICFTEEVPAFMFIFPRPYEGEVNVAFLALDPRVDLQRVKNHFLSENEFFAGWFAGAQEVKAAASSQKIYSPVNTPFVSRVLFAGDTASCQELENTGAMLSGWRAGCCAAAACREERAGIAPRAFKDYLKWWRSVYIDAYPHEQYLMNFAFPYLLSGADDLNYLCSIAQEPLPPCWNPYAATAHLGSMMGALMPTIQQERPDMAQRLSGMSRPMSEILKETTKRCLENEPER